MLLGSLLLPVAVAAALPPYVVEEISVPVPSANAPMKSLFGVGQVGVDRIREVLVDRSTTRKDRQKALHALRLYGAMAWPLLEDILKVHGDEPEWQADIIVEAMCWIADARFLPFLLRCLASCDDTVGGKAAGCLILRTIECARYFRYGPDSDDVCDRGRARAMGVTVVSWMGLGDRDRVLDAVQRVLARKDISERRRKICDSLAKVITDQMAEEQAEVTERLAAKAARAAQDAATRAANGE
jgi:hypothetical protein